MLVSSYITPKARKGVASGIEGRGLAALAPIEAGEIVAIKGGHIVTAAVLESLPERLQNSEIQIADDFHLVAVEEAEYEPVMLFINHSCEPNVGFAGNIVLIAMRDISAGEELTTDYALFDDHDAAMECRCGTPSCRGTVSGRDWQRSDLQRKYGSYFSSYLLRRLPGGDDRLDRDQVHELAVSRPAAPVPVPVLHGPSEHPACQAVPPPLPASFLSQAGSNGVLPTPQRLRSLESRKVW